MAAAYYEYDGAKVSAESKLGKELAKWERPFDYRPENNQFPKMLYRAQHRPDGRRSVGEVLDSLFGGAPGAAENWSRRCQLTVQNDAEMKKALENGWREHPNEALAYLEARDNEKSNLTAERHYADARMSEKAQREAAEVDRTTLKQIPAIPEQPVRKRSAEAIAKAKATRAANKAAKAAAA